MLIRLQHHLWNFRENYDNVRFFSLDMSKVFDTISHKSVIEGVMNIVPAVDPAVVNVIINFLQNRARNTSLNGFDSTVLYTSHGVPQGTVLGPPLYNGSTHDIDISDISTTLSTYADDNNPLVAGCNSSDHAREFISSLCHQLDARNLFLNVQKCSKDMLIIFNYSGSNAIRMIVGIEVVDDLKVLGFMIDSKFSFAKHIDKAVKQSNSILFSIWRLGKIGYSKDELAILYRAFNLPKLYYGINVWCGSNVKDLEKINLFQRLFSIWRLGKIGYSKDELAILYRAFNLLKLYYGINVWCGSNVKDLEKINLFQRLAISKLLILMNQYLQLLEELTKNSTMQSSKQVLIICCLI